MNQQYQWPNPISIYPDREHKSYRMKRFRFHLRSWLNRHLIQQFSQFVNQQPQLIPFINAHPDYSYPVVHRFLDKRFNGKQRLQHICDNLLFLPKKINATWLASTLGSTNLFWRNYPRFCALFTSEFSSAHGRFLDAGALSPAR